jgi:hypothetical protein
MDGKQMDAVYESASGAVTSMHTAMCRSCVCSYPSVEEAAEALIRLTDELHRKLYSPRPQAAQGGIQ